MAEAPFIYFDFALCHGTLNGAIQIELGARTLDPGQSTPVLGNVPTARLRCSPAAASDLIAAIQSALAMLQADLQHAPAKVN